MYSHGQCSLTDTHLHINVHGQCVYMGMYEYGRTLSMSARTADSPAPSASPPSAALQHTESEVEKRIIDK